MSKDTTNQEATHPDLNSFLREELGDDAEAFMSKDPISQELTDKGFSLESELVRDDFDGREGAATWAITITRNGREFQTEYTHGCHFRHHRSGQPIRLFAPGDRVTVDGIAKNKQTIPDEPILADVMHSLVCDAQCVADGQTFEDFADDMGYDTDSREAERIYNGCRDEYFALIRLCGSIDLDVLSRMFQDY